MFQRILAATDFSELGNAAAFRAAELSRESQAAVFFVHAMPSEVALRSIFRDVSDAVLEDFKAATLKQAEALAQLLHRAAGRPVAVECVDGTPHRVIAQAAEDFDVDLVVAGAHGQGTLQQLFLGGTISRLMSAIDGPLLITRRTPTGAYSKVCAAVDLGEHSTAVLDAATTITHQTVTALHAVQLPHAARLAASERGQAVFEQLAANLEAERDAALARLIGAHPHAARLQGRLLTGPANSALLESLSKEGADLLVIGRHAGSRLAERVLGSVPKFLAYHAPCDLLLV